MADTLLIFAVALLLTVAGSLVRVFRGPSDADRMMGAQLAGTGGIAMLLPIAAATGEWAILDVALILALLAAFAAVGFVKATTPDGAGDPEEEAPR
jgi:multicomponent Na+:H+ antiporter subunit F